MSIKIYIKNSSRRAVSLKKATGMEEFYLVSEHFGDIQY